MKCAEINTKGLTEIDVQKALETVEARSGTYEEIKEAIDAGLIALLKDSDDNLVGISFNSGKSGVEDTLEGSKFAKRFAGHDVMAYVYKALTGKDIYAEEYDQDEEDEEDEEDTLPEELDLDIQEELGGDVSRKAIAAYLRKTYNHYLSGKESQFEFDVDEDDDEYVAVTDIKWGRKR